MQKISRLCVVLFIIFGLVMFHTPASFAHTEGARSGREFGELREFEDFLELLLQMPHRARFELHAATSPTPSPSPSASPTPTHSPSPSPSPSHTPSPSPSSSPSPSPTPLPSSIQLSEIYACPDTNESEWVELFNPDAVAYSLTGWKFRDLIGNVRTFTTALPAQSYVAVPLSSAILNNDGDQVSLERPDGQILATANFTTCQKSLSFVFANGSWQLTTSPTPGGANIFAPLTQPSPTPSPSPSPTPTETASASSTPTPVAQTTPVGGSYTEYAYVPVSDSPTAASEPAPSSSSTTPVFQPYSAAMLSNLTKNLTASEAAAESSASSASASSAGAGTESANPSILGALHQSPPPSPPLGGPLKYIVVGCFLLSGLLLILAAYLAYRWYTDEHAQQNLELG